MLKDDGLLIMTYATHGRPQHGTTLNEPVSSPLTIQLGQDYYKNLIRKDFKIINLPEFFSDYAFEKYFSSRDLYFVGIGKKSSVALQERFVTTKNILSDFYGKIATEDLTCNKHSIQNYLFI